jgi:protocatechuate 3,4-dioxygenase alpha subunit
MASPSTPSQTVGPFFSVGFSWLERAAVDSAESGGPRVAIQGRVLDGDGQPVPDAVLEIWQADANGEYSWARQADGKPPEIPFGFARVATDDSGRFRFSTMKPGRVGGPGDRAQAPHLEVSLFMRGLLRRLVTRIYFADDRANEGDPILALVPADRRHTLMARRFSGEAETLVWDVHLQGQQETVFFDY